MANALEIDTKRPIVENGIEFEDYTQLGEHLVNRLSESHLIVRKFAPIFMGKLLISGDTQKLVIWDASERAGLIDRYGVGSEEGRVALSADSAEIDRLQGLGEMATFTLIAHVAERSSSLLDRGLSWVSIQNGRSSLLSMNVRGEHGITDPKEVAGQLQDAEERTSEFVEDLLNSSPNPRYYK